MKTMLAAASHSPLYYFPARKSASYCEAVAEVAKLRERIAAFDPDLVVMLGCDHYGGHQMFCMPSFCVGLNADAIADVGGTAGELRVPSDVALGAVKHLRHAGVDVAVSYKMVVDHGFSQTLVEITGGVGRFPVLPIFVSCIQYPFPPVKRVRVLAQELSGYLRSLHCERVLILATGGLSHDPSLFFPVLDAAPATWRPYLLDGPDRQDRVTQERWLRHLDRVHRAAAVVLPFLPVPRGALSIHDDWDRAFLALLREGQLSQVDSWDAEELCATRGVGTLETATWIGAAQCFASLTGGTPSHTFYAPLRELGIGFGLMSSDVAVVQS